MAYTRTWDEAAPDGATTDADTIDTLFKWLKVDVRERLNVLFADFTTDPVVPLPAILGNVTGKVLYVHHSDFQTTDEVTFYNSFAGNAKELSGFGSIQSPILTASLCALPVGAIITKIELVCKVPTGTLYCKLCTCTYSTTPLVTVLQTITVTAGAAYQNGDTGTIAQTINSLFHYLTIEIGDINNVIVGARVTYDVADCRVTR